MNENDRRAMNVRQRNNVEVAGYGPADAVARLRESRVHASATPYARSFLRFGPSILTDESDVDRALAAVKQL